MIVVLDTCVLFADKTLDDTDFRLLVKGVESYDIRVLMPTVVRQEFIRLIRTDVKKSLEDIKKASSNLAAIARASQLASAVGQVNLTTLYQDAESIIEARFQRLRTEHRDFPGVGLQTLVDRDFAVTRPFAKAKSGFRDTLIWLTVLEIAREQNQTVAFVSSNPADFAVSKEKASELHPDLVREVEQEFGDPSRVLFYGTLGGFNKEHIEPHLSVIEEIQSALSETGGWKDLDLIDEIVFHLEAEYVQQPYSLPDSAIRTTRFLIEEDVKTRVISVGYLNPDEFVVIARAGVRGIRVVERDAVDFTNGSFGEWIETTRGLAGAVASSIQNVAGKLVFQTTANEEYWPRILITADRHTGDLLSFTAEDFFNKDPSKN